MSADTLHCLKAATREWLETNGLGGWSGAHTRRYHGLLVVATCPPVGRVVVLSRLDETLVLPTARVELGCSIFPGAIHLWVDWRRDTMPNRLQPNGLYRPC